MRRPLLLPLAAAALAGCSPDAPLLPPATGPEPTAPLGVLSCSADVARKTVNCREDGGAAGVSRNIMLGGQGEHVAIASSGTAYDRPTQRFTSAVTVQNLIPQPLATADGTTPDPRGLRVFFASGPVATEGSGAVAVLADSVDTFTAAGQPYYEYAGTLLGADSILAENETSSPRTWTFAVDSTVTRFDFTLYVWTTVPMPDGWVVIAPVDSLALGEHQFLSDTVYTPTGLVRAREHAWWSSSDTTVARVDSATGNVFAAGAGTATITAHYRTGTGTATVRVYDAPPKYVALTTFDHSCALVPGGAAYCWGPNNAGQLGRGTTDTVFTTPQAEPRAVAGGHAFTQLVAGFESVCGLDTNGVAWCWGSNEGGQLGVASAPQSCVRHPTTSTFSCSTTPVPVATSEHFTRLAGDGGIHMCGIATTGDTWCWGTNEYAQLGDGTHTATGIPVLPVKVAGGHTFTQIAVGAQQACGLEADGTPWCWGLHHDAYATPAPTTCFTDQYPCHPTPVTLKGGHRFRDIALGSASGCGVDLDGVAWCWDRWAPAAPRPPR
jgi:hypothetical protein